MRELKFRKWHNELQDMTFWDGSKGSNNLFWYTLTEYPDMYNLMQYTGLKDKNGKEIYEGDKTDKGYVIMWSAEHALFCEHFYQDYFKKWSEASYPMDHSRIIISGNIYETPDLLTTKN